MKEEAAAHQKAGPLPHGWRMVVSRSKVGVMVFENVHTGGKQRQRPTEAAQGASPPEEKAVAIPQTAEAETDVQQQGTKVQPIIGPAAATKVKRPEAPKTKL